MLEESPSQPPVPGRALEPPGQPPAPSVGPRADEDLEALPVILYDGQCGLCHRSVRWLVRRDRGRLFYAPLQGPTAARLRLRHREIPETLETVVFVEGRPRAPAQQGVPARGASPDLAVALGAPAAPLARGADGSALSLRGPPTLPVVRALRRVSAPHRRRAPADVAVASRPCARRARRECYAAPP
ncbi:MAG: DUF393 domain-containing protein [Myxococcales bacterium]|nr:DUF393 domain-containing protein [Myxococcales bacterium]